MPKPPLDLQGKQFGQLTVIGRDSSNTRLWKARCSCGKEIVARGSRLVDGTTKMCQDCRSQQNTTHGHSRRESQTPTYKSWRNMKQRCLNPAFPSHAQISYTPEWKSFETFLADMGERPEGMTLDRINVFRGYEKANCRWATAETQTNNRRNTVQLVYDPYGLYVVASINEWARFLRDLTGNQKWTPKALRAIIDSGTMDLHQIVKGLSPELRAHERLVARRELERNLELSELQQMIDELLANPRAVEQATSRP